ncbi:MAG TPA: hypothetical protein VMU19_02390 [Bryobacteraceae bacterium]|nr:hypothetical protein [Bryobacteraceae bacterium]
MKLRMQGNSLRLRLTRPEVERLRESGAVVETARFSGGSSLTYQIRKGTGVEVHAGLADGALTIYVPTAQVDGWAASDEVGISAQDGVMHILIEKDFRCLTRPPEEEPDAYPNPEGSRC